MKGVTFKRIPTVKQDAEKCSRWVTACSRDKFTVNDVDKTKYVCSKHFVDGNTDNEDFPDPWPAHFTQEQVSYSSFLNPAASNRMSCSDAY
jgi:hypothetical protein